MAWDLPASTGARRPRPASLQALTGWCQAKVVRALGWRTSKLSRYELASRVPDPHALRALLQVYEVPTSEWPAYFAARRCARGAWLEEQIVAADHAEDSVRALVVEARYEAMGQVAHQLSGLLWAHERSVDRPDVVAALQAERALIRSRLAATYPGSAAVPVVAKRWGARAQALRAGAVRIAATDLHVPRTVAEDFFDRGIVAGVLAGHDSAPQQRPVAALVIGPTATTAAIAGLREALPGGAVAVLVDELRAYHPAYPFLLARHPGVLVDITEAAARWWQTRAVEHLATRRLNMIVDTLARPQGVVAQADALAAAGYEVHLHVLGVPPIVAELITVESYRHQTDEAGAGHWTAAGNLHSGHATIARILALAQQSDAITDVTVHPWHHPASGPEPVVNLNDRPPLAEQLHTAHTSLTPHQQTAIALQFTRTLQHLVDTGHAEGGIH